MSYLIFEHNMICTVISNSYTQFKSSFLFSKPILVLDH